MSEESISTKHVFALSGRVVTSGKRRTRSGEEERFCKKDKLDSYTDESSLEELSYVEETEEMGVARVDMSSLKQALREVLREEEVKKDLTITFTKQVEVITKNLADRIVNVEQENKNRDNKDKERDTKMHELEARIDRYEQSQRNPRIIITGLKDEDMEKDKMTNRMGGLLGIELTADDIAWVQKLRIPNQGTNWRKNKLRVVLKDDAKKQEIFKAKPRLKGQNVWVSDDLTPFGSGIAYQARQAVRTGKIKKTWVYDSKVFIVKKEDDRPIRIFSARDIPQT